MKKLPITPIILCGGSGSRLWPLSRETYPKQFLSINPASNKSLLQLTLERIKSIENLNKPILVCNEEHRFIAAEQLREINVTPQSIILEPFGKNTAPAILIATLQAMLKKEKTNILVLSSDHNINNDKEFIKIVEAGVEYCEKGKLVTFGIVPTFPEVGYGYIEAEKELDIKNPKGQNITRFIEKPNLENAKIFLKNKRFTWNSGIFLFQAETLIKESEKLVPNLLNLCRKASEKQINDLDFQRLNKSSFEKCPNVSIDVAIMEKTKLGVVLPMNVGWNDIGSWKSVWEISKKDLGGNLLQGKTFIKETKNCYLRSENRLVVGLGIQNLVVIETNDAILVADKNKAQEVKNIVRELNFQGLSEGKNHKKVYRPWGNYLSLVEDLKWQVKLITVKPGEKLSLQLHNHRAEHWVVVKGIAKIEIDNKESILQENQSTYIPISTKHRLSNPGKSNLLIIEVQSGSYLGEDDIIRFEDNYGRVKKK